MSRLISTVALSAALGLSACGQASTTHSSSPGASTDPSAGVRSSASGATSTPNGRSVGRGTRSGPSYVSVGVQATQPTISPPVGGPLTVFTLKLTSHAQLGSRSVAMTTYDIAIVGPRVAACGTGTAARIDHGTIGERISVRLRSGSAGWCAGRYRATVFLQQGPQCRRSQRCPEFRTSRSEVGSVTWTVAKTPRPVAPGGAGPA